MMITIEQALATGRGTWRTFSCPVHQDNNPSARVNVETGRWVCMSCGAKGLAEHYQPDPDLLLDAAMADLDRMDARQYYAESWLDQFDGGGTEPGDYWLSRFTREACAKHRLGWDYLEGRAVYPFRDDDGQVSGVVQRALPGERPKYRYPGGVDASEHLFGYHRRLEPFGGRWPNVVVLVEGAPDAVAVTEVEEDLDQASEDVTAMALGCYGKVLHPRQVVLLMRLSPALVVVAFNGDEWGRKGQHKALRELDQVGLHAEGARLPAEKDLADLPAQDRVNILTRGLTHFSTIE